MSTSSVKFQTQDLNIPIAHFHILALHLDEYISSVQSIQYSQLGTTITSAISGLIYLIVAVTASSVT